MKKKYIIILLLVAYGIILGAPFLFRPKKVIEDVDRKLYILSPHPDDIKFELSQGFKEWMWKNHHQKVKVEWMNTGGGSQQVKFVLSEFTRNPDGIGIDMFAGGGIAPYIKFDSKGLLYRYRAPAALLKSIPAKFAGMKMYDADAGWYGMSLSTFGIITNIAVAKEMDLPIPRTWSDLADTRLYDWISSADPANSSSAHMMFEIMTQSQPWEDSYKMITRIGGNTKRFIDHSSMVPHEVGVGEVLSGTSIDFYASAQIAESGKNNVIFVLPKGKTVVNADPMAILKGAPNRDLAELFIQYSLSEDAQARLMLPVGAPGGPEKFNVSHVPMIPELLDKYADISSLTFNPYNEKQTLTFDFDKSSARWDVMNDLWRAMIVDNHELLKKAWGAVRRTGNAELEARLFEPLVTEKEVTEAGKKWNEDVMYRTNTRNKWRETLRNRYEEVIREAK